MKLLLSAFDPFGGDVVNPALEAVKLVPGKIGDTEIVKLEVPTVFRKSINRLVEAIKKEKPDAVLCVGQAGGRFDITPERVAINVDDARIPDNEGNQPVGPIYEDGDAAYFATLPIKAMVQKIREAGLPSSVSNTAGTFVCNHIMYGLLYHIARSFPHIKGGFIHVPFIPEQVVNRPAPAPYMALADIAKALEEAVKAIGENKGDLQINAGKEH
ncbi:MAG: pyroglutamyl-peptidase I [Treponema sp.]|jgi:pyroglutamyl-peptidase|nr:pyroglutamyl-peptidase I [Treponema sp.]